MNYNLNILTTVEQCQEMLTVASVDKEKLDFRKESLSHRMENSSEDAQEVSSELAAAQALLQNYREILEGLPQGAEHDEMLDEIAMQENEVIDLTARNATNGFASVMNEVYNYQSIARWRTRMDAFMVLLDARTTTLST